LSKEVFTEALEELETKYSILIKGETNPEQESELRVELIDLISTLEANAIIDEIRNKSFLESLKDTRQALMAWDPYGPWFRQQKELVDSVYNIIVKAKNVVFTKPAVDSTSVEEQNLRQELTALKSELNDLKSLMKDLMKTKTMEPLKEVTDKPPTVESASIDEPKLISQEPVTSSAIEPTEGVSEDELPSPTTKTPPPSAPKISPVITKKMEDSSKDKIKEADLKKRDFKEELEAIEGLTVDDEEPLALGSSTVKKLQEKEQLETSPTSEIAEMKSIISDAERATEKQIKSLQKEETSIEPPVEIEERPAEEVDIESVEAAIEKEPVISSQPAKTGPIIPPIVDDELEPTKEETISKVEDASDEKDPYMQLLTLEAEKYRLEKSILKSETAFQEGSISKKEFENNVEVIKSELDTIREKITQLREKLTT
jgi:hypothetical protein